MPISREKQVNQPTLKKVWTLLRHWAVWRFLSMTIMLVAVVIVLPRALDFAIPPAPSPWHQRLVALRNLVMAAAMIFTYALSVWLFEHRSAAEVRPRFGGFLIGMTVGLLLINLVFAVLWTSGHAMFSKAAGWSALPYAFIGTFGAVLFEELLMRAVLFRIAEASFGTTVAVIISATIFGLLHALNPGSTVMIDVTVALEAGVLLALAYVLARNIWLPVGIHLGWNFTEGSFYGTAVSGRMPEHTFLHTFLSGPASLTGGAFGPEGSVLSIVFCLLASAVLLNLIIKNHQWQPVCLHWSLP